MPAARPAGVDPHAGRKDPLPDPPPSGQEIEPGETEGPTTAEMLVKMARGPHRPLRSTGDRAPAVAKDGPALRARLGWFTARGWPLFALTGSKRPYAGCRACPRAGHGFAACPHPPGFCHGHLAASLDAAHLARLWRMRPDSVPGISLGPAGLLVLDADSAVHGQLTAAPWAGMPGMRDGLDVLREVFARHGQPWPPTDTLRVATPSGGAHLYY